MASCRCGKTDDRPGMAPCDECGPKSMMHNANRSAWDWWKSARFALEENFPGFTFQLLYMEGSDQFRLSVDGVFILCCSGDAMHDGRSSQLGTLLVTTVYNHIKSL